MLTRVVVQHYKSLANVDLRLGRMNVFVGPNAVGKSNVIDSIRFIKDALRFGLDRAISDRHGVDSIRQWSPYKPYQISLQYSVESKRVEGKYGLTLGSYRGQYRIISETAEANVKHFVGRKAQGSLFTDELVQEREVKTSSFVRGEKGSVVIWNEKGERDELPAGDPSELYLRSPKSFEFRYLFDELSSFEAFSIFPNTLRIPQGPSNEIRLSSSGDNFTSVFKSLQRTQSGRQARQEIIEAMRETMPELDIIRVESIAGLMTPVFRVRSKNRYHDFNVSQVSDGTLRLLGILTALFQPLKPKIIAMEEPEQMINPGVLAVVAEALEQTSDESQILITTHSPEILDHFAPENIIAVDVYNGTTIAGHISEGQKRSVRERLFTLGEIMAKEGLIIAEHQ